MRQSEMRNPKTTHIDKETTRGILDIIQEENFNAVKAIDACLPDIEKASDAMVEAINNGGRVFYLGAGTSGRLGVCDAAECPPTFGVPSDMFTGIIAGGYKCMHTASENAEDSRTLSVEELKAHNLCEKDIVIGISASGTAMYVISGIEYANEIGAVTVSVTNNEGSLLAEKAKIKICAETGPEVITGSTRMKAGTAQKLILNMISTTAMIKCGYVYENLMINLRPTNKKLTKRMVGIVENILKCSESEAEKLLIENNWSIKDTVGMAENKR